MKKYRTRPIYLQLPTTTRDLHAGPSISPLQLVPPELVLLLGEADRLVGVVVVENKTEVFVVDNSPVTALVK